MKALLTILTLLVSASSFAQNHKGPWNGPGSHGGGNQMSCLYKASDVQLLTEIGRRLQNQNMPPVDDNQTSLQYAYVCDGNYNLIVTVTNLEMSSSKNSVFQIGYQTKCNNLNNLLEAKLPQGATDEPKMVAFCDGNYNVQRFIFETDGDIKPLPPITLGYQTQCENEAKQINERL